MFRPGMESLDTEMWVREELSDGRRGAVIGMKSHHDFSFFSTYIVYIFPLEKKRPTLSLFPQNSTNNLISKGPLVLEYCWLKGSDQIFLRSLGTFFFPGQ